MRNITPAEAIAELDRSLAEAGEDVILRRYTAASGNPRPKIDILVRAFVRPVDALDVKELVGNLATPYFEVVVSPTGAGAILPLVRGDKILVEGRERNIELPRPVRLQNVLVRMKPLVAG
ncbi:UNVERIFIED_ORG: hypothetical protein LHK14_18005 [Roseateles sp. XES5]|nr:hypothetical protein [Roseateles sp. XES5]